MPRSAEPDRAPPLHLARPHRPARQPALPRLGAGLIALIAAGAGIALAWHYPIAPGSAALVFALLAVLAFRFPLGWLTVLFALLPVVGFAPWTGWITFEEVDLLVLAAAAGGYARLALLPAGTAPALESRERQGMSAAFLLLLALFGLSTLVAMQRGFTDAGGFQFGWFEGYHEPMNSLRLAKSFFLAALLLPLWRSVERESPGAAARWLTAGLLIGLAAASLATVWERIAFTGLLNFSADYRTTALFWEMHVGGAALDGFLALSVPFALYALMAARSAPAWASAAAVLAVAGYASATTFSRGVYLALPIGAAVTMGLYLLAQRRIAPPAPGKKAGGHGMSALLLLALFALAAAAVFPTGGYRGLLALLGLMAVWLPLAQTLPRLKPIDWGIGAGLGLLLAALVAVIALLLPKGPYIAFVLAEAAALSAVAWRWQRHRLAPRVSTRSGFLLLAGFVSVATAMAMVNDHWGGIPATVATLPVLGGLLVLTAVYARSVGLAVPSSLRWQGSVLSAMLLIATIVAIFGGGAYMAGRFSTGGKDLQERGEHWRAGLALLAAPADWALGKGLGRFPASTYFANSVSGLVGDYRVLTDGANHFLQLSGGSQGLDWGSMLRVSQRVAAPAPPVTVHARVQTDKDVQLHFEVCEKQLLYNGNCLLAQVIVKALPGQWQNVVAPLKGNAPRRGAWYAPALISFSMAVASPRESARIDTVTLVDATGRDLLANGDFERGMAQWFFSSDRVHLPWHIKSMPMNVLFDQGAVGLALFALLLTAALWRTAFGHGRDHALAPACAGALAGFAVVGLFDTLLDVPRVALLFYFILMLALVLRSERAARRLE